MTSTSSSTPPTNASSAAASSALRNRKPKKAVDPSTTEPTSAAAAEATTATSSTSSPTTQAAATTKVSSSSSSPWRVVPLAAYHPWYHRLDVGPFAAWYVLLIASDLHLQRQEQELHEDYQDEDGNDVSSPLSPVTHARLVLAVLLGMTLAVHLVLVLLAQWRLDWQVLLGYRILAGATASSSSVMTHGWVQPRQPQQPPSLSQSSLHGSSSRRRQSKNTTATATMHTATERGGIVPVQHHHDNDNESGKRLQRPALVTLDFQHCRWWWRSRASSHTNDDNQNSNNEDDPVTIMWSSPGAQDGHTVTKKPVSSSSSSSSTTGPRRGSSSFQPLRTPLDDWPLAKFRTWRGYPTAAGVAMAERLYGPNALRLQLPTLAQLLSEQVVAPFFLFQVVCVVLWSLDEYWMYALFTLFALLSFETTMAWQRLQSLQRLHTAGNRHAHQRVYVRRSVVVLSEHKYAWLLVKQHELLPGDLVSLAATAGGGVPVPADILLVQGRAVCDEALLTGESIPQIKHAWEDNHDTLTATTTNDTATTKTNNDGHPHQAGHSNSNNNYLDVQDTVHKESILFGGTTALVTQAREGSHELQEKDGSNNTNSKHDLVELAPDHGILGIVLRTGFATTQGQLLRTMAHSAKADSIHTWDTLIFILLLVAFAIVAAAYVLYEGWQDDRRNRFRLVLHVIMIVTSVVPPELPMELSLAVTNSFGALVRRAQVYCSEMYRIPWAGQVDVCCFDKTGTLTSDEMILRGVRLFPTSTTFAVQNDTEDEEKCLCHPSEENLPEETMRVMVGCQALAIAGYKKTSSGLEPAIVGDPLEIAVLKKTGYTLVESNVVKSPGGDTIVTLLHRFAFSSKLKRMTVLTRRLGSDNDIWALTKGAPETMKEYFKPKSVPSDYDRVALHHMSKGRRVLAMGYRIFSKTKNVEVLKKKGREQIEMNLDFAGFLVLDCPLKPDTKKVMTELRESGHRVMMITGDAVLTAVEVARQIEMIPRAPERKVYRIELNVARKMKSACPLSCLEAVNMRNEIDERVEYADFDRLHKEGKASFCVSGDCILGLANVTKGFETASNDEKALLMDSKVQHALADLVPMVSVFARHAPYQKEAVIAALNHAGFTTLMVGDGTNDVGALKRAHVGISIVSAPEVESKQREYSKAYRTSKKKGNAKLKSYRSMAKELQEAQRQLEEVELGDASVAAPFTSRALTIKCVKDVVQQGRCTLVTMLQIYKILGINCLVNAMVLSRLFLHGVKQGDWQMTILGFAVATLFYFVTRAEPLTELSPIRPPSSVLCFEALASITLQCIVHLGAILLAGEAALLFVDPFDPSLVPDGPFNANVLNSCIFLVLSLITVNTFAVNYRGRPFMQNLSENKLLYRSLQVSYLVLMACSLEVFPPLNDLVQLTALPTVSDLDDIENSHPLFQLVRMIGFHVFLPLLMVLDTVLAFAADRSVRQ